MNDRRPIAELLGLKPWDAHEAEARQQMADLAARGVVVESTRRSGRTTRMLVEALEQARASGKPVAIVGHVPVYTRRLVRNAQNMARCCGVDPKLIHASDAELRSEFTSFVDHFVYEQLATPA